MTARTPRALLNFALVGGIGFAIEAVILTSLTQLAGWTPWLARIPSFLTAVLVTWALNRRHTFPGRGLESKSMEAVSYVVIQACGAAVNLAIFGASLARFPQLGAVPVIPLGIGAVGGFAFNFVASSVLLYSREHAASRK